MRENFIGWYSEAHEWLQPIDNISRFINAYVVARGTPRCLSMIQEDPTREMRGDGENTVVELEACIYLEARQFYHVSLT